MRHVLVLLGLLIFVIVSQTRLIAGDEGFYTLASQLVAQGLRPYSDFFYPQTAVLPYIYAGWMKVVGFSWESARLLSGLCAMLLGLLLYVRADAALKRPYGVLAVVLFCTARLSLTQLTTSKSYALTTLLVFLTYLLLEQARDLGKSKSAFLLAGVFLGLAVGVRLLVAPLGLFVVGMFLVLPDTRKHFFHASFWFCLGMLGALTPLVVQYLRDPALWIFNNYGYHMGRTHLDEGVVRERVMQVVFGLRQTRKFSSFLFPCFVYASLGSLFVSRKVCGRLDLAPCFFFALLGLNAIPHPAYVEYQCVSEVFGILSAIIFVKGIFSLKVMERAPLRYAAFAGLLLLFIPSLYKLPEDIERYTSSGKGVLGLRGRPDQWNLAAVREVSSYIQNNTEPGDLVVSPWPGYLFATHAMPLPGLENHFALTYTRNNHLVLEEVRRFRLITEQGVQTALSGAKLLVVSDVDKQGFLDTSQLTEVAQVGGCRIYRSK